MNHYSNPYHQASVASGVHGLVTPATPVAIGIHAAFRAVAKVITRTVNAIEITVRERKAMHVLSKLDNRTLMDIGVHRSEIHHLARRVARAKGVDYRVFLQ